MALDGTSPLFAGRYRNDSARCAPWDYSSTGAYFVTINTKDRIPWFGTVRNGIMGLSDVGSIVSEEWMKTPTIRPYVILDEWVVMPDHIHGIIVLHRRPDGERIIDASRHHESPMARFKPHTLGAIINQFKSKCTKRIWAAGYGGFAWQPRYHDRIIRDADAMVRIRAYIRHNPRVWGRSS
ncbi:MAG: transposase [Candidatus Peribacteraceae bacterium]|jgi:REP element-mobilizing transposase RayT